MIKSILITGANSGLGKECARQLALSATTEKIYLGCRNKERALDAKRSLEASTGRSIFEIVLMDVSNTDSVKAAVRDLKTPVDALVMNAGGMGGKTPTKKTVDGVTEIFATNVLGHALLLKQLLEAEKLTQVAVYASSEAARGVPKMGMKRPTLKTSSVDEFAKIGDGTFFGKISDPMAIYGPVKYMATMWMGSIARKYPKVRIVTVSPGGTSGTEVMNDLPPIMQFIFRRIAIPLMPYFGLLHPLKTGAKRYIDVLNDTSYKSGVFYGSKAPVLTGPLVDQGTIFEDLNNEAFQDNAYKAIDRFI